MNQKKSVIIIGGGPASMMLACSLDISKFEISIYEKNATLGRKFLVAGDGGFNLTHSEDSASFIKRYTPSDFIKPYLTHFSNTDFIKWLSSISIETFVGSSKRLFPVKGIKPVHVLNAIEQKLINNNATVFYRHQWKGWDGNDLVFLNEGELKKVTSTITVFALGGNSWRVTGSDGEWAPIFKEKEISVLPFYPSNCAFKVDWIHEFISEYNGQALKNVEFRCGKHTQKGEAVITQFGIEGSGIYAFSKSIRQQLLQYHKAIVYINFKPEKTEEELIEQLVLKGNLSIKDVLLKNVKLSQLQYHLIKYYTNKEIYSNPTQLVKYITKFPITIIGFGNIDEAISTVGGIDLNELTPHLELSKLPNNYCMGEMLNWDAPTGGYLLQACFSMGNYLANYLNNDSESTGS